MAGTLAIVLVAGLGTPAFANPVEQIINGDFETGTFAGWTITSGGAGSVVINDGTVFFPAVGGTISPISGSFDAVTTQFFPSINMLSEPFVVPSGVQSANVNWNDRIFNAAMFSDPNQEIRVEIRDSTGTTILASIFDTNPGDPSVQPGPNARSFDITTVLQSLEGQSVRLCFTQEDNLGNFHLILDDVSLTIDTMLVGGELLPIDSTALMLAGLQSSAIWMLPVLAGVAGSAFGVLYIKSRRN